MVLARLLVRNTVRMTFHHKNRGAAGPNNKLARLAEVKLPYKEGSCRSTAKQNRYCIDARHHCIYRID